MKDHEFLRIIEETCLTLNLSRPCITQIISFYRLFQGSETHSFKTEIVVVACIYLSCKINEEMRKTRDILNMTYIVTASYKKRNKELAEQDPETYKNKIVYTSLKHLENEAKKSQEGEEVVKEGSSDWFLIENVPSFSLEKYNSLRDEILKAEQHLLRILNYDLENKYESYYQLFLKLLKDQILPQSLNNKALAIYNDSFFVNDLKDTKEDWRVLFSILLCLSIDNNGKIGDENSLEFTIKMAEKFDQDKACSEEFERFSQFLYEYYSDIEELQEKKESELKQEENKAE